MGRAQDAVNKRRSKDIATLPGPPKPEYPYWLRDNNSIIGTTWLVLGPTFCGVRAIARVPYMPGLQHGVRYRVIPEWMIRHFALTVPEEASLQSIYEGIKSEMLSHGADPLAVQWLGELSPFTEKEMRIMADKLKTKGAAAPKKEAAKKEGGGRKGNPEALAKARAARAEAGPDTRKITVLKKENPYREGSNRAASFAALKGAKTVEDYKNAGGAVKYISRWESEGIISLK